MSAQKLEDFFNEMIKLDPEHDSRHDSGLPGLSGSSGVSRQNQAFGASTFDGEESSAEELLRQPPEALKDHKRGISMRFKEKRRYKATDPTEAYVVILVKSTIFP